MAGSFLATMDPLDRQGTKMEKHIVASPLRRLPYVCELTGLRKSSIYAMMRAGEFPSPVHIGRRAVAWCPYKAATIYMTEASNEEERSAATMLESRRPIASITIWTEICSRMHAKEPPSGHHWAKS